MTVYQIRKKTEKQVKYDIPGTVAGGTRTVTEVSFLPEIYGSFDVANKYRPKDTHTATERVKYDIIAQQVINE